MDLYSSLEGKLRKLRRSGSGYALACCPVHKGGKERNPSFSVNLSTGSYHCFSCGIKGDFLDLQRLVGISGHVPLEQPEKEEEYDEELDETILSLFKFCPKSLLDAGFTQETLKYHEVGFDPTYFRITFPIRDENGILRAISGRTVVNDPIRYKVYTRRMLRGFGSEMYKPRNKSYLWMAHTVDPGDRTVFLAEGFKACMWLRQCGVKNVVATMGTQVTRGQIAQLRRIADRAIIIFDMDDPGRIASKTLLKRLLNLGLPASIITYPVKQPDELTQEQITDLILRRFNQ